MLAAGYIRNRPLAQWYYLCVLPTYHRSGIQALTVSKVSMNLGQVRFHLFGLMLLVDFRQGHLCQLPGLHCYFPLYRSRGCLRQGLVAGSILVCF